MFGKFALSFVFFFFGLTVQAAQIGTVTADETYIYLNPDFDAPVIATAKLGEKFQMSNTTQGPFYKVRMKDKRLGWISSVDIKPGNLNTKTLVKKREAEAVKPLESAVEEQKVLKAFANERVQGPFMQQMFWREKTLGHMHTDNLTFYGWNWTGFNTLTDGPAYIDTRVMGTFTAPDYYKKLTGVAASGWILKAQTALLSANPWGENFLFHYGFGVSTTFSHFRAGYSHNGVISHDIMEDFTVGLVLPLGMSYRIGPVATQLFYQFYQEKVQTSGILLGVNWVF